MKKCLPQADLPSSHPLSPRQASQQLWQPQLQNWNQCSTPAGTPQSLQAHSPIGSNTRYMLQYPPTPTAPTTLLAQWRGHRDQQKNDEEQKPGFTADRLCSMCSHIYPLGPQRNAPAPPAKDITPEAQDRTCNLELLRHSTVCWAQQVVSFRRQTVFSWGTQG